MKIFEHERSKLHLQYEESRGRSLLVLIKLQVQMQLFFSHTKIFSYIPIMMITATLRILSNSKLVSSNFHIYLKLFQSLTAFSLVVSQNVQNLHVPMIGHSDRTLIEIIN